MYSAVHMTYIPFTWGHFFSHSTPVWPWPVIQAHLAKKSFFCQLL